MRRQEVQMQFQIHTLYTHKLVYLWKRFFKHYFIGQKQIHSLHFKKFWKTNPPTTHTHTIHIIGSMGSALLKPHYFVIENIEDSVLKYYQNISFHTYSNSRNPMKKLRLLKQFHFTYLITILNRTK